MEVGGWEEERKTHYWPCWRSEAICIQQLPVLFGLSVASQHRRTRELRLNQPQCVCGASGVSCGQGAIGNTCMNGTSQIWVLPQCSQAFIVLLKLATSYTAAKISLPANKLKINWRLSNVIRGLEWGCIQLKYLCQRNNPLLFFWRISKVEIIQEG